MGRDSVITEGRKKGCIRHPIMGFGGGKGGRRDMENALVGICAKWEVRREAGMGGEDGSIHHGGKENLVRGKG